jgi:hypothetical protein
MGLSQQSASNARSHCAEGCACSTDEQLVECRENSQNCAFQCHSTLSYAERVDGIAIDAQIYPNPSNTEFNLTLNSDLENTPAVVTITDLSGRLVDTFNFDGSQNTIQFGNNLMNGVYMVTVQQGDFKNVTRVLKTN